ncbi:hypothetical protein EV421DRAFT_1908344 [Armillaria borealis]|uniref:Uncharacterized protein n=1 Tax=Armillaria borealis TaxID=47425 RepID=A0AA39J485_9AGAR|nr:hypothetical protein EV421DRAFT_1908344 [Armillaria borealis]
MDEFYDYAKARGAIQTFTEESIKLNPLHMSGITQRGAVLGDVMLQKDDDEHVWQLMKKQGDDEMEELVFACNGVIADANLPPIVRTPGIAHNKAITMAQSVTVTGLGCHTFDDAIVMLQEIRLTAEREFKSGMLDKWSPTTYHGFPAFVLSNRYFRTQKEGGQHKEVIFSKDVDPVGILQRLAKNDLIHTEENEMQYFKRHVDDEGKRRQAIRVSEEREADNPFRYQWARPQLFRVGDIVEVQCSIIIVKGKALVSRHDALKMKGYLNESQDAKRKMSKMTMSEETKTRHLKRKIGYGEEQIEEEDGLASKRAKESQVMDESG